MSRFRGESCAPGPLCYGGVTAPRFPVRGNERLSEPELGFDHASRKSGDGKILSRRPLDDVDRRCLRHGVVLVVLSDAPADQALCFRSATGEIPFLGGEPMELGL